jgi:glycosyltransferase involved in cell wall biosynthesis
MALLSAADVYCQPNEGPDAFGLSFVEALVSGLPVVSTELGAVSEIVDASCGLLATPHLPAEIASALQSLLDDDVRRAAMSVAARTRGAAFTNVDARMAALAQALGTARRAPALQ